MGKDIYMGKRPCIKERRKENARCFERNYISDIWSDYEFRGWAGLGVIRKKILGKGKDQIMKCFAR